MNFFKVTPLETAKDIVKQGYKERGLATAEVDLATALNMRAAFDVCSDEKLPDYDRSVVDGYAVKAASTYGATDGVPSLLHLVGKAEMGVVDDRLEVKAGECVYVPTGGAVPNGTDCVVMIENTAPFGEDVAVYKSATVFENVMRIGDDVKEKDVILKKGQKIDAMRAGLLAALGKEKVRVFVPLKVGIISTGDEIVEIGGKTGIGQIRDANTTINSALCKNEGFEIAYSALVKDGFENLENALNDACEKCDVVLISGGSSVGTRDFTEKVIEKNGEILVHGLALKPGKPTIVARVKGKSVFGLPGHPMACLIVLRLLVLDAYDEMMGDDKKRFVYAKSALNFHAAPGRASVQPVSIAEDGNELVATPLFYKSGMVSVLASADGYVLLPREKEGVERGEKLKVFTF